MEGTRYRQREGRQSVHHPASRIVEPADMLGAKYEHALERVEGRCTIDETLAWPRRSPFLPCDGLAVRPCGLTMVRQFSCAVAPARETARPVLHHAIHARHVAARHRRESLPSRLQTQRHSQSVDSAHDMAWCRFRRLLWLFLHEHGTGDRSAYGSCRAQLSWDIGRLAGP